MFEQLASQVAEAPPVRPTPLSHENLLNLFKGDAVGRGVVLEPATMDDMCAGQAALEKPSLEVVYEGT
jgi:chlorophyllide a reductase subunit X